MDVTLPFLSHRRVGSSYTARATGVRQERVTSLSCRAADSSRPVPRAARGGLRAGRHHYVVAGPRRDDPAVDAAPRHDDRVGGEAALEDLVPAHERAAVRGEELVHAACEPALQLVFVLEPVVANAPLRERARL